MFTHAPTITVRSCLVCGSSFTGYRNRLYCCDACTARASKERDYWPKVAKQLEHLGWLVSVIDKQGEFMVDTPPIMGATRRSMWVNYHAPISHLERLCKAQGLEFPLTGWADFQPGEVPVPMELVERALKKYALCDFCGQIVLRSQFVPSLGACEHCLEKHEQDYGTAVWQDLQNELSAARSLRERITTTARGMKALEALEYFSGVKIHPLD